MVISNYEQINASGGEKKWIINEIKDILLKVKMKLDVGKFC